jgi:hypothetical protein
VRLPRNSPRGRNQIGTQCGVCRIINWHSAVPLINFCKRCGQPLVDKAEIDRLISEPLPPIAPQQPKPPTGFLAALGAGSEYRNYTEKRAVLETAQRRYEEDYRHWGEQVRAMRLSAVARHIWAEIHSRMPPASVERMTGVEFEAFLHVLFVKMGYSVSMTPASGDQGADLIVTESRSRHRIAVQAKRSRRPVSNRAVQEVVAAMTYYACSEGMVVTNAEFTPSALALASRVKKVALWDGLKLASVYSENFPTTIPPFDQPTYDEVIGRLRQRPYKGPLNPDQWSVARWQDRPPTQAQARLLWNKDSHLQKQFKDWRTLHAHAVEQHLKGDSIWSRGGFSKKLDSLTGLVPNE